MKRRTSERLIMLLGITAAVITWISGYYVMKVACDTLVGAVLFASLVSLIVFCESRFTSISLKSDGKVSISREEITNNWGQFVLATLTAVLVSIPLSMMIVESCNGIFAGCLNDRFWAFITMVRDYWLMIGGITLFVVVLFNAPIIVRLKSIDE